MSLIDRLYQVLYKIRSANQNLLGAADGYFFIRVPEPVIAEIMAVMAEYETGQLLPPVSDDVALAEAVELARR